jgi:hypothetical protein
VSQIACNACTATAYTARTHTYALIRLQLHTVAPLPPPVWLGLEEPLRGAMAAAEEHGAELGGGALAAATTRQLLSVTNELRSLSVAGELQLPSLIVCGKHCVR